MDVLLHQPMNLPTISRRRPTYELARVNDQPPSVTDQPPSVTDQPPSVTDQPSSVTDQSPPVTDQPPPVTDQPPPVTTNRRQSPNNHHSNGVIKELVFPKALDLDRPKRARTTFSPEQLFYLEREFQRNQYLVGKERTDLARRLGLSETQVKVWFQNRRTKYKRDRSREAEIQEAKSESVAACNLLRIMQQRPPPIPSAPTFISPYQTFPYIGYSTS
ncbi:hypothetical protein ScPMuIL_000559 [Solemya velum]